MNAPATLPVAHNGRVSLVAKIAERYSVDPGKMLGTLKATAFRVNGEEVTDEQMMALLIVSDQYGLNPFTKELFAYPDKHKGIVPVVSVDGWCRIINDHPQMDGIEFEYGPQQGAHFEWIECVIYRKDRSKPIRVREFWAEVFKSSSTTWGSHPNRMHRHKALIQCGRVAFGFGGIYEQDEAMQIVERDVSPPAFVAPIPETAPRKSKPVPVDVEPVGEAIGGAEQQARGVGDDPPKADAGQAPNEAQTKETPAGGAEPIPEKKLKLLRAKMAQVALTDLDFNAKWGKTLCTEDGFPNFTTAELPALEAWIESKREG